MSEEMTLARWLLKKYDTKDYRLGKVTGEKHPKADQDLIDAIGRKELLRQAGELEKEGIIRVKWTDMHRDIKKIDFPLENMTRLYEREGLEQKSQILLQKLQWVCEEKEKNQQVPWLFAFLSELEKSLRNGKIPAVLTDSEWEKYYHCLFEIGKLKKPVFYRVFSANCLGNSKIFERKYKKRASEFLKKYDKTLNPEMNPDEILAEHNLLSYSQTLSLKGNLTLRIWDEKEKRERFIETKDLVYGTILNAATLVHVEIVSLNGVKRVLTIENKANYEEMEYDEEVLYIYVHGFPSPKERHLLKEMNQFPVTFAHWSDLDYGGIRIYEFLKRNIFPSLTPYRMNRKEYEDLIEKGNLSRISPEKRKKLEALNTEDLQELKQCILENGMEYEQEEMLHAQE